MPIYIGLGGNLESEFGSPQETLGRAVSILPEYGMSLSALSGWYRSAPVPPSDQPHFTNAVARIESKMAASETLESLLEIERRFGRSRKMKWEPRTIDLDLLDYEGTVATYRRSHLELRLPHVRMHSRAFVLMPLLELDPAWVHPRLLVSGKCLLDRAEDRRDVQKIL